MTVSTTRDRELNINQLLTLAFKVAGILEFTQTPTDAQLEVARDLLDIHCKYLETQGVTARMSEFDFVTLVAGDPTYNLTADVIDVDGDAMYIPPGEDLDEPSGEIPVKQISQEQWHLLTDKSAEGTPTMFYVYRAGALVELRLYPIPDALSAGTLRIVSHRLKADTDDGNDTIDAERYWQEYYVEAMAYRLAKAHSLNQGRIGQHKMESERLLADCLRLAKPQLPRQVFISHRTPIRR